MGNSQEERGKLDIENQGKKKTRKEWERGHDLWKKMKKVQKKMGVSLTPNEQTFTNAEFQTIKLIFCR